MDTQQLHRLRYRYPALDESDLLIEASWEELEREATRRKIEERRAAPKSKSFGRHRLEKFTKLMGEKMAEPMIEACYVAEVEEAPGEPIAPLCAYEPEPLEVDYDFEAERQRVMDEIRERLERLRELGVDELLLRKLFEREDTLSRLVITRDYRILLPDYHNMEIEMSPLPKAVFLLFLRHEEGIMFKFLPDYEKELRDIYMRLTDRVQSNVIEKSIQAICDPTQNAINEKCARIREAFIAKFDEHLAMNYFITGVRGSAKRISLQRNLVVWEE